MNRQDWRTPPSVFLLLNERFGPFELDIASDDENHLCKRYRTEELNGPPSADDWRSYGPVFCNPPFGDIMPWAVEMARHGNGAMLAPANVSSPWFQCSTMHAKLYLPNRRIGFWHPDEKPGSPDRDTVIFVFGQPSGRVATIGIPDHAAEIKRLWQESNGQGSLF